MKFGISCAFICMLFLSSCVDEASTCVASTQNLSGTIDGTAWSAGDARATTVTLDGVTELAVVIYEAGTSISDLCSESSVERTVTTTVPMAVGNYNLRLDLDNTDNNQTVTVNGAGSSFDLVTVGCLEIISLNASELVLRMSLQSAGSDMDGTATVSRCN